MYSVFSKIFLWAPSPPEGLCQLEESKVNRVQNMPEECSRRLGKMLQRGHWLRT